MIPDWPRYADASRRTLSLQPCGDIYCLPMQVCAIGNRVTDVYADAKSDGTIVWLVLILDWNLLLHLHCAAYSALNAVEYDEKRIAARLNYPAAMVLDRLVYQCGTQDLQTLKRPHVIQPDKPAVTDHVSIDYGDQLPPGGRPSHQV
jgi:hypothetical protein